MFGILNHTKYVNGIQVCAWWTGKTGKNAWTVSREKAKKVSLAEAKKQLSKWGIKAGEIFTEEEDQSVIITINEL